MQWSLKKFSELSTPELYAILQLRSIVFVVEQHCPYLDTDDKDQDAWHLLGWQETQLVAYTRLLPPGLAFEEPSIGRVVTAPRIRRTGIGRILMQKSIDTCHTLFGITPIQIGAQQYLESFYSSLGFEISGSPYLEDGIPHVHMILR
jgi:ElaA protein